MGEKLLLINPAKPPSERKRFGTQRKRGKPMKKTRTAKQEAATRKLVRLNKARAAERRRKESGRKTPARKRNPISPRKRTAYSATRTASSPRKSNRNRGTVVRRRRRNPRKDIGFMENTLQNIVMPAGLATAGAIGMDWLWGQFDDMLPLEWKTGNLKYLAKGGAAVSAAWLIDQIPQVEKETANALGVGALTAVMYQFTRQMMAQNMPEVKLDGLGMYEGMGYYSPAIPAGGYNNNDIGLYVANQNNMGLYVGEGESSYYNGSM